MLAYSIYLPVYELRIFKLLYLQNDEATQWSKAVVCQIYF